MTRLILFVNNWLGWKATEWLSSDSGQRIVGAVLHPLEHRAYGDEILGALPSDAELFDATTLREDDTVEAIQALEPELGLSILFDHIIEGRLLKTFPDGVLNLHPAYLPYNRGQYPNVWSIVDRTPAGTTLHYLDEGIDTGDIVARRRIEVEPIDTGQTLYRKLEQASLALLQEAWPDVVKGSVATRPQSAEDGTYHRTTDVEQIDHIDLDATYIARELIDILRARTFPPHEAAYFIENGEKVFVRVDLEYAEEYGQQASASGHRDEE